MASASSVLRALRQRSTQGCSPSISRRPQCTTSWSSTTSTRSLRSPEPDAIRLGLTSGTLMGHRQSHAPDPGLTWPELDQAAELERLQHREPQAHPGDRPAALADPVVADLHHPGAVLARELDLDPLRPRVLAGVAHGLDEDRLRERLELLRHPDLLAARSKLDAELRVRVAEPLELLGERRLRR